MAKKSRKLCFVSYVPPDVILSKLQIHQHLIRGYAFATHDMDEGKEPHTHIVLWLYEARLVDSVRRWFRYVDDNGQMVNTLGQICHDIPSAYEYLTHKNDADKYQYSSDIVVCTDSSLFEADDVNEDTASMAIDDLLNGVPLADVARKYGRDFIFHYPHIRALIVDIKRGIIYE